MSFAVQNDLADRLASISCVMGMDEEDEELLWRHIADYRKMNDPQSLVKTQHVVDQLSDHGVLDPVQIVCYHAEASMPERFYSNSAKRKAMVGIKLIHRESFGSSGRPALHPYVRDLEAFTDSLVREIQQKCFTKWYPDITNAIRSDNINWEPPTYADIQVKLTIESKRLRSVFGINP